MQREKEGMRGGKRFRRLMGLLAVALVMILALGVPSYLAYRRDPRPKIHVTAGSTAVTGTVGGYYRRLVYCERELADQDPMTLSVDLPLWRMRAGRTMHVYWNDAPATVVSAQAIERDSTVRELYVTGNEVVLPRQEDVFCICLSLQKGFDRCQYVLRVDLQSSRSVSDGAV